MKRTYQENKSLYESIMRDVAKIVKKHLNEDDNLGIEKYGHRTTLPFVAQHVHLYLRKPSQSGSGVIVTDGNPEQIKKYLATKYKYNFLIVDGASLKVNDFYIPKMYDDNTFEIKLTSVFDKYDGIIVRDINKASDKVKNLLE